MPTDQKKPFVRIGFIRSFGRTASRMNATKQAQLEAALEAFALKTPQSVEESFSQKGPLTVELGVGKGEQILERAADAPCERFLACEVFKNGLQFLVRGAAQKKLENLKIYPADARQLLVDLPKASVDTLLVLYPDPWPKARHKRRRLVNEEFFKAAKRVLKPTGELILVTDIVDYALWMLHAVYAHGGFFPTATTPQAWATPPKGWVSTGYERKAQKEGRSAFYFRFHHKEAVEQQNHNKGETTAPY